MDALWVHFMQHPEDFPLLETQAALKKVDVPDFRNKLEKGHDFYSEDNETDRTWLGGGRVNSAPWVGALAAVFLLSLLLNLFRSPVETELTPAIAKINPTHLISPDVSRSTTDNLTELEKGLYRAYLLSISGNLDAAISEYEMLAGHGEPGLSWIRFNLAVVHYNAGNYSVSAGFFRDVDCTKIFEEPGRTGSCNWFKTNSFVAAGDLELAWEAGNRTMEQSIFYRNDAINLLRKIRYVMQKDY